MSFRSVSWESRVPGRIKLTGNDDILVVGNEVLENVPWTFNDIHISPINPRMFRCQSACEQVVSCLSKSLSACTLELKGMTILDTLTNGNSKVLLDNLDAVECQPMDSTGLNTINFGS